MADLRMETLGSPSKIRLVELGPGKGTLMNDILRVAVRFPAFHEALSVHMVEMSESMRALQKQTLGCRPRTTTSAASATKVVNTASTDCIDDGLASSDSIVNDRNSEEQLLQTSGGIPITWHSIFSKLSSSKEAKQEPLLLVAQEFLDALRPE